MVLIIFMIFIISLSFFLGIFMLLFSRPKVVDKLKYFDEGYEIYQAAEKKEKRNILRTFSKIIPNFKFNSGIRRKQEIELLRADIPLTYNELLVIKSILSLVGSLFVYLISRDLVLCFIVLVVLYKMPNIIITSKKKKRIKEFDEQLTEAIIIISNSLKAGYSFYRQLQ
ncbi:hypothetical protein PL321_01970 [Caloramator sp. mosi_1]|uniref:type II secretion system F family protein n=1 Tax=Caloramator sp. mosi_1 TaxID=3023090 RepID=UPI00236084B8|nr:hypothetical protein [Caloramator sp. mosi_1]WDC84536.1 hypothetical protein PL321_01970 [Caloramator sp. mosi_1]